MNREQLDAIGSSGQTVDFEQHMRDGLCSFCMKPVSLSDGTICFFTEIEGNLYHANGWNVPGSVKLRYPCHDRDGGTPVAMFTHFACGPDVGYWLALDRMSHKEVFDKYGLLDHINEKCWASIVFSRALRIAAAWYVDASKPAPKPRREPSAKKKVKKLAAEVGGVDNLLNEIAGAFDLTGDE